MWPAGILPKRPRTRAASTPAFVRSRERRRSNPAKAAVKENVKLFARIRVTKPGHNSLFLALHQFGQDARLPGALGVGRLGVGQRPEKSPFEPVPRRNGVQIAWRGDVPSLGTDGMGAHSPADQTTPSARSLSTIVREVLRWKHPKVFPNQRGCQPVHWPPPDLELVKRRAPF